jgi:hypothetical protein
MKTTKETIIIKGWDKTSIIKTFLFALYLLAIEANIATQQMWRRLWKSL